MLRTGAINLVLKIGLILSSLVFAIFSFIQGAAVIQYYPSFIINIIGESTTLILGSLVSICLAIWLLSRKQRFAAVATYFVLLSIGILFNITSLTFLGMVWPLWCISFALALRYYPRIRVLAKDSHGRYVMKIIPAATAAIIASEKNIDTTDIQTSSPKTKAKDSVHGNNIASESVQQTTSTPAFVEENNTSDLANKSAPEASLAYEVSHDVDATLDEIFAHAGLHTTSSETASLSDELSDDVIGHTYTPTIEDTTPSATTYADTEEKEIKRPKVSRKKVIAKSTEPSLILDEITPPLEEIVSVAEHPRIARKRAKAKTPKTNQ
ncbi:MAG: hypothetical protein RIQ72_145 [Candidatus Parcubacteria bacterium]|jgi:hypothetical protein